MLTPARARQLDGGAADAHRGERVIDTQVAAVQTQLDRRAAAALQLPGHGPQARQILGQLALERQAAPLGAGVEPAVHRQRRAADAVGEGELRDVHDAVGVAARLDVERDVAQAIGREQILADATHEEAMVEPADARPVRRVAVRSTRRRCRRAHRAGRSRDRRCRLRARRRVVACPWTRRRVPSVARTACQCECGAESSRSPAAARSSPLTARSSGAGSAARVASGCARQLHAAVRFDVVDEAGQGAGALGSSTASVSKSKPAAPPCTSGASARPAARPWRRRRSGRRGARDRRRAPPSSASMGALSPLLPMTTCADGARPSYESLPVKLASPCGASSTRSARACAAPASPRA